MNTVLPARTPNPAVLATDAGRRSWKAAQDFEAMALNALLQPMFSTIDNSKSAFGGGQAEEAWRPMLTDAIAKKISAQGGLGLAVPVFNQMLRMQEGQK